MRDRIEKRARLSGRAPLQRRTPIGGKKEPDDVEALQKKDVETLSTGFMQRMKEEAKRVEAVTDSEFWVALCFPTRDSKEEFLRALKWDLEHDGDKYIDGVQLAKMLGVKLSVPFNIDRKRRAAGKLPAMALDK